MATTQYQSTDDRKKWLNDYFKGKIAHTFDTIEKLKEFHESGIITYVYDNTAHCGYYILSKEE